MDALSRLADGKDVQAKVGALVASFRTWIDAQKAKVPTSPRRRRETAEELLKRAEVAAKRMEQGIALLNDPVCLEAFRIANRAMAEAARKRLGVFQGADPATIKPAWRPFQLAFLLMNLPGIADPKNDDRGVVDLLFFPTGGGKTEAYLGLAAFTLVLRRLRNPGLSSAGLSVLMRYTLRLLTLDQLARAATLICALELERQRDVTKLGEWPFEIGLWVGKAATPNRMGAKGDNDRESARAKTITFKNDDRKPSPILLENCPWCNRKFKPTSFNLIPNPDFPTDLRIAQVGFTRFEAASPDMEGELEMGVRRAALAREITWLPGIENKGEGVFLQFRREAVEAWFNRPDVQQRGRQLNAGFDCWKAEHPGSHRDFPGLPYLVLHSFSHLLITAVSLECGYPASSIRERIYALPKAGFGILIYTGTSDAEGTLGGLIEVGRRIHEHIAKALEMGELSSNDPVCAQHQPENNHERRFLLGAACHGCLLIAETSCEQHNDFLDRALVVPTVENLGVEFFRKDSQ